MSAYLQSPKQIQTKCEFLYWQKENKDIAMHVSHRELLFGYSRTPRWLVPNISWAIEVGRSSWTSTFCLLHEASVCGDDESRDTDSSSSDNRVETADNRRDARRLMPRFARGGFAAAGPIAIVVVVGLRWCGWTLLLPSSVLGGADRRPIRKSK